MAPPQVLDECSLEGVARYIKSEECKDVFIMAGAGLSTSAGIPDFRSPETGLYANLARLKLPYPEAVFDIRFFRKNPLPFYTLAHELAPGRFRPTISHSFIRLLHEKNLLHTCFTQNIDTLERKAGIPENKIVEAHGSFASQHCINCKSLFEDDKMKAMIRKKEVPKCEKCSGLVKPDIVFFGEALPPHFQRSIGNLLSADLLIIIGTSLTVHPFASLTEFVTDTCPRVLINLEEVGDIGSRTNDVVVLGKCDDTLRKLAKLLDWEMELDALWDATEDSVEFEEDEERAARRAATAEEEVQKLADEVQKSLKLAAGANDVLGKIAKQQDSAGPSAATEDLPNTGEEADKNPEGENIRDNQPADDSDESRDWRDTRL